MSKIKVELNSAGVRALLKSPEMEELISSYASEIQGRAGADFESETRQMPTRVVGYVRPGSVAAFYRNLEENTLLKAVK